MPSLQLTISQAFNQTNRQMLRKRGFEPALLTSVTLVTLRCWSRSDPIPTDIVGPYVQKLTPFDNDYGNK
jgi:hypothetical protein